MNPMAASEASLSLVKSTIWKLFGGECWFIARFGRSKSAGVLGGLADIWDLFELLSLIHNPESYSCCPIQTTFINKKPQDIPEVHLPEESKPATLEIAFTLRIMCCEKLHPEEI